MLCKGKTRNEARSAAIGKYSELSTNSIRGLVKEKILYTLLTVAKVRVNINVTEGKIMQVRLARVRGLYEGIQI